MALPRLQRDENTIVLSVYYSGSAFSIDGESKQLGFYLHEKGRSRIDEDHNPSIFIEGCGVAYGLRGNVFGTGTDKQAAAIAKKVEKQLKLGKRVVVNAYGHSRGAISCLLLAKMLGDFDPELVEVNLALMDPVPGNSQLAVKLDVANLTLANQAMDLSDCKTLRDVLAIYCNKPSYLFHTPLVPTYPAHCQVTEEIVPGEHSDAQWVFDNRDKMLGQSRMSLDLVSQFFHDHGSLVKVPAQEFADEIERDTYLLQPFATSLPLWEKASYVRPCHAKQKTQIVTVPDKLVFNTRNITLAQNIGNRIGVKIPTETAATLVRTAEAQTPAAEKKPLAEQVELFKSLMEDIFRYHLSQKSLKKEKGDLLLKLILQINDTIDTEAKLKNMMRNAFALCLQRDRNRFSLISLTSSARGLKSLLNSKKYQPLRTFMSGKEKRTIYFGNLRSFVRGKSERGYFNSRSAGSFYSFFRETALSKLTTNHTSFYLKKPQRS